jgi:hypothetical protein
VLSDRKLYDGVFYYDALKKMKEAGKLYEGKPYDLYFEWNDEIIYCSELVWKIYKNALIFTKTQFNLVKCPTWVRIS